MVDGAYAVDYYVKVGAAEGEHPQDPRCWKEGAGDAVDSDVVVAVVVVSLQLKLGLCSYGAS